MGMHATKDRVESDTSTVYSISLYESIITTRDEPWFGELKLALGVRLPVTARDRVLPASCWNDASGARSRFRKMKGQKLGKNSEVHLNRPMKNERIAKRKWCAIQNKHKKKRSVEEKQSSSFPSLPGSKAVQSFLAKSRI
ncbi:unnamed protein product [Ilex paraguariensis]|uniref:Uncharacterized protein n=1 Tax=Ilex paraguariensis TaxID=185542 RepID=A0ABC8RYZ5_9AQUA